MATPKFVPLSNNEETWLRTTLEATQEFVIAACPDAVGRPLSLAALDQAFAAWLSGNSQDTAEINAVINMVGVRFGQFLVEGAGFQWIIASDKNGTDLAVLALPRSGDVLVYPANFVAKRWERRESNFLATSFDRIKDQVAQIATANAAMHHRPWWKFW